MVIFPLLTVLVFKPQDVPQDILKRDLPKSAHCAVCTANGAGHEAEKAAAGVLYKGKSYFFCSAGEVATFKKNPETYVPFVLPMALPPFDLKDQSGKRWNSEAFKGRVVLIDFWATWCKPCLALKPGLDKVRAKYMKQGFEMLSVSVDEKKENLDKFLSKNKWDNTVLHDQGNTWLGFRLASIPYLALVKDGQLIREFRGSTKIADVEKAIIEQL